MAKHEKVKVTSVAKKAGVSIATVSRVINNPSQVKEETRLKVQKVIEELNYKPDVFAQALASRRPNLIAVVVPDFTRSSVAEIVNDISNKIREYKYQMMFFLAENEQGVYIDVWPEIEASRVDGILYLNDLINHNEKKMLEKTNLPVISCNGIIESKNVISVDIDYYKAAKEITNNLISRGKKKIVLATTNRPYYSVELKEKGYLEAMKEAGLKPYVLEVSGRERLNRSVIENYLKENSNIEGVIGVRDSITISFMNTLIDEGYTVPDQVEIYSMQNTRQSLLSRPKLSVVSAPAEEISKIAVEILSSLMNEEDVDKNNKIVKYEVIERETTKKVKK